MVYLASLFLIAALLAVWRFRPPLTLASGVIGVIVAGSVLGHPFWHLSVGGLPLTLDRLLLVGLLGFCGYQLLCERIAWSPWNRVDLLLACFLAYLIANVFTTDWGYRDKQPLANLLFNYFGPFGIYLVARQLGNDARHFKTITFGLMGLGGYLAFIAICEVREWYALIYPKFIISTDEMEFLGRGRGPFLNPVACGLYQMMGLCAGLVWWPKADTLKRAGLVAFALLMLTGIFCTLTRSIWLGTIVALGTYVWMNASWKWRGVFLVSGPVAAALLLTVVGEHLNSFKRDKDVTAEQMSESIELRPLLAVVATRMIEDKPFLGHGLRQYSKNRAQYITKSPSNVPLQKVLPYVQHNLFLSYAVDLGLIGLMIYLASFVTWLYLSIKLWLTPALPWDVRQTGYLLLAFLIGFTINGLFHDVSVIVMMHQLLFLLVAWASGQYSYFYSATSSLPIAPSPSTWSLDS